MESKKYILPLPEIAEKEPISMTRVPRDVLTAMGRTVGGISTAERLAKMHSLEDFALSNEAREWAEKRLFAAAGLWQKYNDVLEHKMPNDSYAMAEMFPELSEILMHMYETTVKDTNAAHLNTEVLLVPYADMLKNIDHLPKWLSRMREAAGLNPDHLPGPVKKCLSDDSKVLQFIENGKPGTSFKSNLDFHVREGGEWGIYIVRDTQESDMSPLGHRNLRKGTKENHSFDHKSYGFAEWIADSLQRDPRNRRRIMIAGGKVDIENEPEQILYALFDPEEQRYKLELSAAHKKPENVDIVPIYGVI